jgi:hypothetical protein
MGWNEAGVIVYGQLWWSEVEIRMEHEATNGNMNEMPSQMGVEGP